MSKNPKREIANNVLNGIAIGSAGVGSIMALNKALQDDLDDQNRNISIAAGITGLTLTFYFVCYLVLGGQLKEKEEEVARVRRRTRRAPGPHTMKESFAMAASMIGNRITRKMMEVRDGSVDAARYVGGSAGEFVGRKINDAIGVVGELPDDVRAGFKFTSESTSSALGAASLALRGRLDRLSGSEPPEPGVDAGTQTEFDDVQLTELRYKFIEKATAFPADPELEAIEARKSTETESVLESFRGELSRMRDELRKEKLKYEDLEGGLRGKDGKIAELEAENAALAGDKEKLRVDLERLQNVAAVSDIVSPPGSVPGPPVRVFHPHMVQVFPAPVPGMVPVFPVPYYQGGGAPAPVYRDQFGGTLGEHGVHYPPQTSRTPHSSPQRPDADRVDDGAAKEKRDREGRA